MKGYAETLDVLCLLKAVKGKEIDGVDFIVTKMIYHAEMAGDDELADAMNRAYYGEDGPKTEEKAEEGTGDGTEYADAETIRSWMVDLSKSQGYYGRLVETFDHDPEMYDLLAKEKLKTPLDMVLLLEEGE